MIRSEFPQYNALLAVAEHRSFRKAAVDLGLSPSALSHAIASLEGRLGVQLIHRTTRSVSLSDAGERFIARVRPALSEIAIAVEEVNDSRESPSGSLRINLCQGATHQILRPIVVEYLRRYPNVSLELITDNGFIDIVAEGFDAGVRRADAIPQDMVAVPLGSPQRYIVVAAPEYLAWAGEPRTPAEILTHACIRRRLDRGTLLRWTFENGNDRLVLDAPGNLTLSNDITIVEAAREGIGLAYVHAWTVRNDLACGKLIHVLKDWTPPIPGTCIYFPRHRSISAAMRALLDLARTVEV